MDPNPVAIASGADAASGFAPPRGTHPPSSPRRRARRGRPSAGV